MPSNDSLADGYTQDVLEILETMAKQAPGCAGGLCATLVPHICQMIECAATLPEGAVESAVDLVSVLVRTGAGDFTSIPALQQVFSRQRDCHLMTPPCTFIRCFNRD